VFDNPLILSFIGGLIAVVIIWLIIKVTKMLARLALSGALAGVGVFIFRDDLPLGDLSEFLKSLVFG